MKETLKAAGYSLLAAIICSAPAMAQEKLYNTAKQKLLDGKQVFSVTISKPDPQAYCEAAKHYDYTWFEMQHSTLTWADIEKMVATCPHVAATPMVRIQDELESSIQHATDIGLLGVIMPTVDTVEKAQATVRYAKYPPEGRRSMGAGQAARIWWGEKPDATMKYRMSVNDNMLVVVMIETPVGVEHITEISNVPGVDAVMVANTDLGNFSGFFDHNSAPYQAMVKRIHDSVLHSGKFLGATDASYAKGRPDSADYRFLQNGPSNDGWVNPNRPGAARGPSQ
ncbi:MAG TPA: aldolase/citrate lyase family protein [Bryobacteraceae bacterium]|jgi:2-keto-3-deoxy-L-rhamnonate aldolase RhmA|nr:aldolase/citrate lyase family protein [Bryobacteraceae bacterium]